MFTKGEVVFILQCTKMNFSIQDFYRKLRIWSYLLKTPLMENFIFCAVLHKNFKISTFLSQHVSKLQNFKDREKLSQMFVMESILNKVQFTRIVLF